MILPFSYWFSWLSVYCSLHLWCMKFIIVNLVSRNSLSCLWMDFRFFFLFFFFLFKKNLLNADHKYFYWNCIGKRKVDFFPTQKDIYTDKIRTNLQRSAQACMVFYLIISYELLQTEIIQWWVNKITLTSCYVSNIQVKLH